MTKKLRVRKIGGGVGISLPKDLGFEEGDELYAIRTAEGLHLLKNSIPPSKEAEISLVVTTADSG